MPTTTTIFSKIIEFQKSMPKISKDKKGVHNANYADLANIQSCIQEPLAKSGLGYLQLPTSDGLITKLFDNEGNMIEFTYPVNFVGTPQAIGSAITYSKRYALTALLGLIVDELDDDGEIAQKSPHQEIYKKPDKNWMTPDQFNRIINILKGDDDDKKGKALSWYSDFIDDSNNGIKTEYRSKIDQLLIQN